MLNIAWVSDAAEFNLVGCTSLKLMIELLTLELKQNSLRYPEVTIIPESSGRAREQSQICRLRSEFHAKLISFPLGENIHRFRVSDLHFVFVHSPSIQGTFKNS